MPRLTLIQMNDTHGYLEPHPALVWGGTGPTLLRLGGMARIATLIAEAKAAGPALAFDNGDTFHGTYAAVSTRGEGLLPVIDGLGLDGWTGHWDFAWGPEQAERLAAGLRHPFLAANIRYRDGRPGPFAGTKTFDMGDFSVGVIGLAATIVDKTMPAHFAGDLVFSDGIDETAAAVARLRGEGCAGVVVLSHLGFPQDMELAARVPGIDVILSGHTHNRTETPARQGETLVIQSGCHGDFLGRLEVDFSPEGTRVIAHCLVPVSEEIPEDPAVAAAVAEAMATTQALRAEVVGRTDHLLHRMTALDAPMDDVLLAAIARAAEAEIAFSNGWRYGAPIPPGPVTMEDLWQIIPVNPPVSEVNLTGAEIREMLEENAEATFARAPFAQRGGYFKRFRGLTVDLKIENPRGQRIERLFGPDGAPLDPTQSYRCAFVTEQAVPKRYGSRRRPLDLKAIDALKGWFAAPEGLGAGLGRVRVV